ncbi:MAG: PAS domain S-box protein [Bacteroidota bacterium]|nr:PAS domain S-box protein [Bacteroidota bacterium]
MPFTWIIFLFGLFIIACGTTHFVHIIGLWWPVNWWQATIDSICAIISLATAIAVWPVLPKLLSIPSPSQLKIVNNELQKERDKLVHTQTELQKAYDQVEWRVKERTNDLLAINKLLQEEINERKRSEVALFESQKLLQEITDNSTSLIYATDLEGRYLLISRSLETAFGARHEMLINKTRKEILPEPYATDHRASDLKVMNTLKPLTVEEENLESDGIHTYVSIKFPLLDIHGTLLGVGGISYDITEQKKAENALKESERLLRESQKVARLGSFVWDLMTDLWSSSEIMDEVFGIDDAYVRSLDGWLNIVHPDWREIMMNYVSNEVLAKRQRFDKEYKIIRVNDGQVHWVHGQAELEFDSNNEPVKLIGTIHDITDRKKAEEEIRILNAELEQRVIERTAQLESANKELEAFSYSVSHDLRAPLRHITSFVNLILRSKSSQLSEETEEYLNAVSNSANEMGKLIEALLTFSRLNRAGVTKAKIDSLQMIRQSLSLFENDIKSRAIEIIIEPLHDSFGDYQLIVQVWTNLISNAIKYTGKKEKPVIEIGSFLKDRETIFFIKDNGAGFDMKYADKLFGVFQRLHESREFEGVGIGLANINRIVVRHGGRCWAEGEVDKGAVFYFSLPNQ